MTARLEAEAAQQRERLVEIKRRVEEDERLTHNEFWGELRRRMDARSAARSSTEE